MPAPQGAVPYGPAPTSGPPARVGAAVAALLCALATLILPTLGFLAGFPLLGLLANIPGIVFGCIAVASRRNPATVEKHIAYTWACNLAYLALIGVIVVSVMMIALSILS